MFKKTKNVLDLKNNNFHFFAFLKSFSVLPRRNFFILPHATAQWEPRYALPTCSKKVQTTIYSCMRGSKRFCQRVSNLDKFLVDEGERGFKYLEQQAIIGP